MEPSPLRSSKSFKIENSPRSPAPLVSSKSLKPGTFIKQFSDDLTTNSNGLSPMISHSKSFRIKDPDLSGGNTPRDGLNTPENIGSLTRRSSITFAKSTNIQVAVRCRPLNSDEKKSGQPSVVTCDTENNSIKVTYTTPSSSVTSVKKPPKHLVYDKVFNSLSRQDEVFQAVVQPIAEDALLGFNCTVFAYGPTGTGKTYTMEGDIDSDEYCGLIPRTGKYLLEKLQREGVDFSLKVSFLEIYNEELEDLLSLTSHNRLKLCEDLKRGVICQHLEEFPIFSAKDIQELLRRGISNRQQQSTATNLNSSRSHAIFTFRISIKESDSHGEEFLKTGQLNLVDLAGSECIGRSGAKNERAREAGSINQSLLTLGRVITSLVDHHSHVPYRDSKLTRLLQESLGGKAKTVILATLSPSQIAIEETLSTLDYAYRAKNIKNQPVVNLQIQPKVVTKEHFQEIETLKSLLSLAREKNGVYLDPIEFTNMEARLATQDGQLQELEQALRQRDEEIRNLKEDKADLTSKNIELRNELDAADGMLEELQSNFQQTKNELHETFIELKSTEAVVEAQTETETSLTLQGVDLLRDLSARQNDVDNLLSKVDRMVVKESERMNLTAQFVSTVTVNSAELGSAAAILSQQSNDHSKKLNAGVEHVIMSGAEICGELQTAIDAAVGELKDSAKQSRDRISSSCGDLNTHLQLASTALEGALTRVQKKLTVWLKETSSSLKASLKHTAALQSLMEESTRAISLQCTRLTDSSKTFATSQMALRSEANKHAETLKSDLKKRFDLFRGRSEASGREAESVLRSKVADLEKTMNTMLRDIVASSLKAIDAQQTASTQLCNQSEAQVGMGTEKLLDIATTMHTASSERSTNLKALSETILTSHNTHTTAVTKALTSSQDILTSTAQSTDLKGRELDENLTSLLSEVSSAVSGGHSIAVKTRQLGDDVLMQTTASATKMSERAAESVTAFNTCLKKEADSLYAELKKHFNVVDSHVSTQQEGLNGIRNRVFSFDQTITESVLKPSGDTPTKTFYRKRAPLAATRDHSGIKKELRDMLLAKLHEHLRQSGGSAVTESSAIALRVMSPEQQQLPSPGDSPHAGQASGNIFSTLNTTTPTKVATRAPSPSLVINTSTAPGINNGSGGSGEKKSTPNGGLSRRGSLTRVNALTTKETAFT